MPVFRPGKPYWFRGLSAGYAPGAGQQAVAFDQDDADGEWGAGSNSTLIEVAIAGLYVVTAAVGHGVVTTSAVAATRIEINGVQVAENSSATSTGQVSSTASVMAQLVVGDTVLLRGTVGGGTNEFDPQRTHLEVVRIGPVRWT